jgi:alanine racemase
LHNAAAIKKYCGGGVKLCAMKKAEAYGHGLIRTAECLQDVCGCFGVARLPEALSVRNSVSKPDILVCGEYDRKMR